MSLFVRRSLVAAFVIVWLSAASAPPAVSQEGPLPSIAARNAIVVDATSGTVLFDKAAGERVAIASLTKLFTAFVAIERTPLRQSMTVSASDLVGEASMGLAAGEVLSFDTLLHGMLLPSGNDAAAAVARNVGAQPGDSDAQAMSRFIAAANARLHELGLVDTHLENPHGLDKEGHYSTARDIALLTAFALANEPAFASTIGSDSWEADGHAIYQTNQLLGTYPGLIGGKTGVTDHAGYCLMQAAERDGRRIVAVLLGSTPEAWYADAATLLDYAFSTPVAAAAQPRANLSPSDSRYAPQSAAFADLDVTPRDSQTSIVRIAGIARTSSGLPWRGLVSVLVTIPGLLVILRQVSAMRALTIERRHARARRPAQASRAPSRAFAQHRTGPTQTDVVSGQSAAHGTRPWGVAPDVAFGDTAHWRATPLPASRHRRRRSGATSPILASSIGD
jgi:D-alanyl-D-alanine carboxypeptidase (penicillin-binding protein 5/6)